MTCNPKGDRLPGGRWSSQSGRPPLAPKLQANGTSVRPVGNVLKDVFSPVGREWFELSLNSRPPGPEDWSHEESTTHTMCDEMLRTATSVAIAGVYFSAVNFQYHSVGFAGGHKTGHSLGRAFASADTHQIATDQRNPLSGRLMVSQIFIHAL
jgi:hypothetical protein